MNIEIRDQCELLVALLQATRPSEVEWILRTIGDSADLEVHEPFGSEQYHWRFYGESESNISTINLGSRRGRSLTERITNAIDAVLEKRMAISDGPEPISPMDAAASWFGRPPSDVESGIFSWDDFSTYHLDRLIHVVLTPGDDEFDPTVDIVDDGIGISPVDFPDTILSLHSGNKIKKRYLAGAFGQGGSATLAFCDYTLIVSRHFQSPDIVGFTIIKKMRLSEDYKEDAYVYLAVGYSDGSFGVPSCTWDGAIEMYPEITTHEKLKFFESGTLVRHCGYRLEGYTKTLTSTPGNLYHLFHYMMFDPLLPFRVVDLRNLDSPKDELVTGTRNRLMRLYGQVGPDVAAGQTGTELRHYAPREMVSPVRDLEPSVGIEYWVPFNFRRYGGRVGLRSRSNELFVDQHHPILGTLNGQNQGELTPRLVRDLQLSMVSKHLIIHIDASRASKEVRSALFSSTREGFKDDEALHELTRVLQNRLSEDEELYEIERELVQDLLDKETAEVDQEVKREITSLLRDAGFKVKDPGEVPVGGKGGKPAKSPQTGKRKKRKIEPLPTLPYPEVTRFEIVYPDEVMSVHQYDNHILKVETDANYRFDREGLIGIRVEPPMLEIASKALLRGGRMNWRLRPVEDSSSGDIGEVIVSLTRPDGEQLTDTVLFEVLDPREEKSGKGKGLVPPFNIIAVDPFEQGDLFQQVWDDVDPSEDDITKVAYRARDLSEEIRVYYSTAFAPYRQQLEAIKKQPGLAELFRRNYEIWIGYHAILQFQQQKELAALANVDIEELERIQEHERAVVAEMQAKQAIRTAETQRQAMQEQPAD